MTPPSIKRNNQSGFTLIEIIMALVLCAFVASLIVVYSSNIMGKTGAVGSNLRNTLKIYSIMERVRLHYQTDPDLTLSQLKSNIDSNEYDDDTTDSYLYNVVFNNYVQCDASATSSFTLCDPATEDCLLQVVLSDPDHLGIRTISLFSE
jgi:prepilin-type N-terminal cleavage/methylation domain-containing protein